MDLFLVGLFKKMALKGTTIGAAAFHWFNVQTRHTAILGVGCSANFLLGDRTGAQLKHFTLTRQPHVAHTHL